MTVLTIQAKIRPDSVTQAEDAARAMFRAIDDVHPDNIRYASCRLVDGVTFLILLQVDEGTDNPLPQLPEFQRFQAGLRTWSDGPAQATPAEVVGSYRLF